VWQRGEPCGASTDLYGTPLQRYERRARAEVARQGPLYPRVPAVCAAPNCCGQLPTLPANLGLASATAGERTRTGRRKPR